MRGGWIDPRDRNKIFGEQELILITRRPLLARGIKAASFGYRSLFNNHRSCFQKSAICWCFSYHHPLVSGSVKNPSIVKSVLKAANTRQTVPQASEKQRKYTNLMKQHFCGFFFFLQYFPCENQVLGAPSIQISHQKSLNKWPGNMSKKIESPSLGAKQFSKCDPKITSKPMQILSRTPSRPSCCSRGPPRWLREAIMIPHGAKIEALRTPNDNREELKGAGGRGCSP